MIAASGPLRSGAIRTEYGGTTPMRLGNYRRGHASLRVRKNAADNLAVNHSAAVGETVLRMGQFRGQEKGWTYTNTTNRLRSGGNHYYPQYEFGADWSNGNDWPMFFINNAVIGSYDTSTLAVVMQGRTSGAFTFTNNNEIQGAGGQPNSGGGQIAFYIQATNATWKPRVINNYAIRGGGGAGGIGGTGGTGGQGYYVAQSVEGDIYSPGGYVWDCKFGTSAATKIYYNSNKVFKSINQQLGGTQAGNDGCSYTRGALGTQSGATGQELKRYHYSRSTPYNVYTSGGGGGGGGNGGRGIGYGAANLGGSGGAGGGAPQTNAGWGGTGGTGGTGGSWGAAGNTGNTGATGGGGNYTGGSGGYAGAAGGAGGYSIYAEASTPWSLTNTNTLNGPIGGGTNPS